METNCLPSIVHPANLITDDSKRYPNVLFISYLRQFHHCLCKGGVNQDQSQYRLWELGVESSAFSCVAFRTVTQKVFASNTHIVLLGVPIPSPQYFFEKTLAVLCDR